MESVTLFRLVMACLGGVSLAAALYQWWGERQQAFVSGVCARARQRGGGHFFCRPLATDHCQS
jgi:hypothetical protein